MWRIYPKNSVLKRQGSSEPRHGYREGFEDRDRCLPERLVPYCDGVYSGFTDAHLNDPADFLGFKTNKMFILTQAGNHDALHYGNLVTYLRLNGLVPSGGWF